MQKKIFYQWAAVGILSLVGWGVDVMPGNESWMPSVAIWSIQRRERKFFYIGVVAVF